MARHSRNFIASAVVLALAATLATGIQAGVHHPRHHLVYARGGDVVVHTGRSYLDSGTSAEVGTENHYFSDSVHYGPQGPGFTSSVAGFELLPTPLNPPGRNEAVFQF